MEKKIAVTSVMYRGVSSLKRAALIFDGFCLSNHTALQSRNGGGIFNGQDYAEFDYLNNCGLILEPPPKNSFFDAMIMDEFRDEMRETISTQPRAQLGDDLTEAPMA